MAPCHVVPQGRPEPPIGGNSGGGLFYSHVGGRGSPDCRKLLLHKDLRIITI